uniref:Uncharacterized protein n=1 Tax=Chromera velia CCMP2878 TaxID=1169474 RepID=A0A0G4FK99_9ALVE|mmetsp:Transcript_4180/g.8499  ORF Transcript_4180/g.8499 Transcript_4180/m.8499 type:complete len:125 (+) Transcript_4180:114-488(+)|eukprot:Cvel_17462.t1-p1 / transcript=Cvel_17462.t1 / gene=Cvel_17462 / organism=Chromera_velia_CCMP2878 / gene_product=hypothetical protein / transcript_product=hypothetical protein / location=Cvel_scaffold1394:45303-45812(+) / protein_length=124 / sequence_SO=supercontig / SO=protein_coding / is_pseudo=false
MGGGGSRGGRSVSYSDSSSGVRYSTYRTPTTYTYRSGASSGSVVYSGRPTYSRSSIYSYSVAGNSTEAAEEVMACVDVADWKDNDGDSCADYANNQEWCNDLVPGTMDMTPQQACCASCPQPEA